MHLCGALWVKDILQDYSAWGGPLWWGEPGWWMMPILAGPIYCCSLETWSWSSLACCAGKHIKPLSRTGVSEIFIFLYNGVQEGESMLDILDGLKATIGMTSWNIFRKCVKKWKLFRVVLRDLLACMCGSCSVLSPQKFKSKLVAALAGQCHLSWFSPRWLLLLLLLFRIRMLCTEWFALQAHMYDTCFSFSGSFDCSQTSSLSAQGLPALISYLFFQIPWNAVSVLNLGFSLFQRLIALARASRSTVFLFLKFT